MTWMAAVVIVSVLVALLRGGKLANLADLHLAGWWMLLLAFAMQIGATFAPDDGSRLPVILVLASFVPLLAVVWLNKEQQGLWIAGIGILMTVPSFWGFSPSSDCRIALSTSAMVDLS